MSIAKVMWQILYSYHPNAVFIDLGTINTLVVTRDGQIVANEPSMVVYQLHPHRRKQVVGVGNEAKAKYEQFSGYMRASYPLIDGSICDLDTATAMLRYFLEKTKKGFCFANPKVIISIPKEASKLEPTLIKEAGLLAGASEVTVVQEPLIAALGVGATLNHTQSSVVVDIGGSTTEISVVSNYKTIYHHSLNVGGRAFDQAIREYIFNHFKLVITHQQAESLKKELAFASPGHHEMRTTVRGIDYVGAQSGELSISGHHIYEALSGLLDEICMAAKYALAQIPAEVLLDINHLGVKVTGGGGMLQDIGSRMSQELGVTVEAAEDPITSITRGGRQTLLNGDLLKRVIHS